MQFRVNRFDFVDQGHHVGVGGVHVLHPLAQSAIVVTGAALERDVQEEQFADPGEEGIVSDFELGHMSLHDIGLGHVHRNEFFGQFDRQVVHPCPFGDVIVEVLPFGFNVVHDRQG